VRESTSARFYREKVILACDAIMESIRQIRNEAEEELILKRIEKHNRGLRHRIGKKYLGYQDITNESGTSHGFSRGMKVT
jgi:hypothetical protein